MSAILEYQKTVYNALQANSGLVAQVQGIYDSVPQNAVSPYVYFGNVTSETAENLAKNVVKINFTILCVSETLGKLQAAQIAEKVRASLHLANLSITGYTHINTRFIAQEISLTNNGINYFTELNFEAIVSEI